MTITVAPASRQMFGGAGQLLDPGMPYKTVADVAGPLQMNWTVSKRALYFGGGSATKHKPIKVAGSYAMVRDDTNMYLGTVGKLYEPVQNTFAFGLVDELVSDHGCEIVGAGSILGGKRVWLAVSSMVTAGDDDDQTTMTVVMQNSHDGTKALTAAVVPIRLFCTNQLPSLLRRGTASRVSIRHTPSAVQRAQDAVRVMRAVSSAAADYTDTQRVLQRTRMDESAQRAALEQVLPGRTVVHDRVISLVGSSTTIDASMRQTAWGLVNAASEYFEWGEQVRTAEARLRSAWTGQGAQAVSRLSELALASV